MVDVERWSFFWCPDTISSVSRKNKIRFGVLTLVVLAPIFIYFFGLPIESVPFELPQSPMTAYRIAGNESDARTFMNEPNTLRGYSILQERPIDDAQLHRDIASVIGNRFTYGGNGAMCFEPGIAVRFGQGDQAVEALICLDCGHVYFFKGGGHAALSLSEIGKSRIKSLYARMFPGHSADVEDEDSKHVKEQRSVEADRRLREATSQASTAP
jgi:hypothetical protein